MYSQLLHTVKQLRVMHFKHSVLFWLRTLVMTGMLSLNGLDTVEKLGCKCCSLKLHMINNEWLNLTSSNLFLMLQYILIFLYIFLTVFNIWTAPFLVPLHFCFDLHFGQHKIPWFIYRNGNVCGKSHNQIQYNAYKEKENTFCFFPF